ncbi:unnamed protein product [Ixodes persulcatus]
MPQLLLEFRQLNSAPCYVPANLGWEETDTETKTAMQVPPKRDVTLRSGHRSLQADVTAARNRRTMYIIKKVRSTPGAQRSVLYFFLVSIEWILKQPNFANEWHRAT